MIKTTIFFALFCIFFIDTLNWLYFAAGCKFFFAFVVVENRHWNTCSFILGRVALFKCPKYLSILWSCLFTCIRKCLCAYFAVQLKSIWKVLRTNSMLHECRILQSGLMIGISWFNSSKFKSIEFSINHIQKCSVSCWKIDF